MATLRYIWGQYASPLMLLLLLVAVVVGVAVGVGLARVRARRGKAPLSRGTYLVGVLLWLWLVGMVCVTLLGSRGIWVVQNQAAFFCLLLLPRMQDCVCCRLQMYLHPVR